MVCLEHPSFMKYGKFVLSTVKLRPAPGVSWLSVCVPLRRGIQES